MFFYKPRITRLFTTKNKEHGKHNKKDGYRQQNVRQRQKLISIIDYDVCILEYLQPFWRYSTSKNGLMTWGIQKKTFKKNISILNRHSKSTN